MAEEQVAAQTAAVARVEIIAAAVAVVPAVI
jgi:hypothetical protein